jgi:hypothetical protein
MMHKQVQNLQYVQILSQMLMSLELIMVSEQAIGEYNLWLIL